ncbi:MAG: MT-A70 family methyltransferase [Sphaerochaeta sp.]|jgi:N6-adenosine-specific RNA methylase IME4|nr:MT-A70 family methyltransferase [Sphaerochaeta sp.]
MGEKYKVIYADCPWSFRNKRTGGSMSSGSASQYPTMSLQELSELPIPLIADRDSVCFLWASVALLPDSLSLLSAWGYRYKTALFWRKVMSLGMGFWFRGQVEMCLLGVRGRVKAFRIQKPNFIQSKVRNHSQKPNEVRELIDMTGLSPKLELFARERAPGWDAMGFDIDGKDIRLALVEKIIELGDNV